MAVINIRHQYIVSESSSGVRLDSFLHSRKIEDLDFNPSRAFFQIWIKNGFILVNGLDCTDKSYKVKARDVIEINADYDASDYEPPPEAIDIHIVYRDEHLLVIDKPPGVSSHPVPGNLSGTVINFLKHKKISLPESSDKLRPGIVHRLDKNTSGLMIIALSSGAMSTLVEMIKRRDVNRKYLAIVYGSLPGNSGKVDAAIKRNEVNRRKMQVSSDPDARHAVTHYQVLKRYPVFSLVACTLETGRTHQIRVHLSHIGYPVVGDPLYGGRKANDRIMRYLKNLDKKASDFPEIDSTLHKIANVITSDEVHLLHAAKLSFPHPVTGRKLDFESRPHGKFMDMMSLLETLDHQVVSGEI